MVLAENINPLAPHRVNSRLALYSRHSALRSTPQSPSQSRATPMHKERDRLASPGDVGIGYGV